MCKHIYICKYIYINICIYIGPARGMPVRSLPPSELHPARRARLQTLSDAKLQTESHPACHARLPDRDNQIFRTRRFTSNSPTFHFAY